MIELLFPLLDRGVKIQAGERRFNVGMISKNLFDGWEMPGDYGGLPSNVLWNS